ncbi:CLUMA_CG004380, isoform C [Clunio marinus]|uniref:CLUMA_CG004380, isoform C n=1 Tax=Clunio marinus TaxID=568069 RepID=A0A1J1HX22_9DIPT|nr:CLUMA_CG004380, isoform C [Clunio marinus]
MLLMALGLVETGSTDDVPTNQTFLEETLKISTNIDADESGGVVNNGNEAPDLVWTFVSQKLGSLIAGQCHSTYSLQPLYYHIGCAFFLLAFLAPSHRLGAALYMRCMLVFGCILFAMWSYLTECRPDVLLWSAIFILANLIHMVILICKLRPVKFDKEIEEVYVALFKPLRVSRRRFKKILSCLKAVRQLKHQEIYVQEKITKVDSLSLVLSGKFVVSQNQKALHIVFPHQFLDSPEYFGVSTDDYFQVSITAIDESKLLIWHRDKLKLSIITDEFLQVVFDHILGRDVVKKLMQVSQVSETMAQSNGFVTSHRAYDDDDKPMLLMKKSVDNQGNGLTALINKQLQAENPEHVPLITPSMAASKHQTPNAATSINISNNVTNGHGLIDNSDQPRPMSPVLLSSNTPAHIMRSRLNQYKVSGTFNNNIIVNFDGESETTTSASQVAVKGQTKKKDKKKTAVAEID